MKSGLARLPTQDLKETRLRITQKMLEMLVYGEYLHHALSSGFLFLALQSRSQTGGTRQRMGENCRASLMTFALGWIASREFFECATEVVGMKISQFVSDFFYRDSMVFQ